MYSRHTTATQLSLFIHATAMAYAIWCTHKIWEMRIMGKVCFRMTRTVPWNGNVEKVKVKINIWKITTIQLRPWGCEWECVGRGYVPLFRARILYHPVVQCAPKWSSRVDTSNSFCIICVSYNVDDESKMLLHRRCVVANVVRPQISTLPSTQQVFVVVVVVVNKSAEKLIPKIEKILLCSDPFRRRQLFLFCIFLWAKHKCQICKRKKKK